MNKMKRITYLLIIGILFSINGFSQNDKNALDILNKASAAYNKAGGVKATFTAKVLNTHGVAQSVITGSISLKGSKFKLVTESMTTWFDGTNQWVYIKKNNEVNLSKPTEKELLMVNPINVFELYKHGYTCKLLGDKTEGGKKVFQVELKPSDKNETVQNITASFDKTHFHPVLLSITNKNKLVTRITINSYAIEQKFAETLFVFQQKEYPNSEVIDLR